MKNIKFEILNSKQILNSNNQNLKLFWNLNLENWDLFRISILGFSFLLIICFFSTVWAEGSSPDPAMSILDAKQIALGRSGSALEKEPFLILSNPAGLADMTYPKISSTTRKIFFDETQYLYLGGAIPLDYGTIGFAILDAQTNGSFQTKRDAETGRIIPNPSKEAISFDSNIILVSYAKKDAIKKGLNLGANLKLYNQGFGGGSAAHASAWGIDLAGQYRLLPYVNLGATWQNFLTPSFGWSSGAQNTAGSQIKIGSAVNILGKKGSAYKEYSQDLIGTLDLDLPSSVLAQNNNIVYHLGFEWLPQSTLNLRAGYDSNLGLAYGIGFKNYGFRFDYAYACSPYAAGDNPHYFTLSYAGELIKSISRKLIKENSAIKFLTHKDKDITTAEAVSIKGEATYNKTFDEITSWIVPSISQKDDHKLITEEAKLTGVKINNKPLNVAGAFEVQEMLYEGRNVFYIEGKIPGKDTTWEAFRLLKVVPYKDVPLDYWAFRPITLISTLKIIKGYPGNEFKPENGISRAELVAVLLRASQFKPEGIGSSESTYTDVKTAFWAAPYIIKAANTKLVTGYQDGTFKPDKVLSRAEAIVIISRFAGLPEKDRAVFPDLKEGFWANKFVAAAADAGLLKYLGDNNFEPNKPFSRAEAAEVLCRTKMAQKMIDKFWDTGETIEKPATGEASKK